MNNTIKRPSIFLNLTEIFRAMFQLMRGYFYLNRMPKSAIGKGKPVLVIPGLLSTDRATALLRKSLSKQGYEVSGWEMGMNRGRMESIPPLIEKLEKMQAKYNQKVIVIGWSMGGIFAREITKLRPELVSKVVTIGSPFADVNAPNNAKWAYELLNKGVVVDEKFMAQLPVPAPVPTLAMYSKSDGIVPWEACRELLEDENHTNMEIFSSHLGMGVNPDVMQKVAAFLKG